jgi:hypothetical protein
MTLDEVIARMPYWYIANVSPYLRSGPGRGKTSVLSEASRIIGQKLNKRMGLVIINGTQLTPMHMIGFGTPVHTPTQSIMKFTRPFFWVTTEGKPLEDYDGGTIVVDEEDKCDVDVKKMLGEGRYSGRFGPHELPPGWQVWGAGNRASDRSGGTKELDHLINRRMEINITDDLRSLIHWMNRNDALPVIKTFAEQHSELVFQAEQPKEQRPWCTPRQLMKANNYLAVLQEDLGELPDDPSTVEECGGMIGDAEASQLFAFVRLENEMPKYERIIKDPTGVKVPDAPDAQMLICYHLAAKVQDSELDPVIRYVRRLDADFAVTFAKAACSRKPMFALLPPMKKWSVDNSALMSMLNSLPQPARSAA